MNTNIDREIERLMRRAVEIEEQLAMIALERTPRARWGHLMWVVEPDIGQFNRDTTADTNHRFEIQIRNLACSWPNPIAASPLIERARMALGEA